MPPLKFLAAGSSVAALSSLVAALDRDALIAWGGAIFALAGAAASGSIAIYHRLREAARDENRKDHEQSLEEVRALARVQVELELRIAMAETRCTELAEQIKRISCRYPRYDGSARCTEAEHPPLLDTEENFP